MQWSAVHHHSARHAQHYWPPQARIEQQEGRQLGCPQHQSSRGDGRCVKACKLVFLSGSWYTISVPALTLAPPAVLLLASLPQAIAATGRIVKSDPGHLEALTIRGQAYMYLAEHDMAKRHFGEALKFDPDHKDSRKAFNKLKDLDRKRQRANRCDPVLDECGLLDCEAVQHH